MAVCAQSTVLRTRGKHSKTPKYQSPNRGTPDHDPSPSSSSPRCTDAAKADDNGKPLEREQFFLFWPATSPSTSKQNKRQPNVCRSWLPLPLVQRCILQSGTSHWCHDSTAHHELLSSKAKTSPPTQRQTLGSHPMSSGSIATTHAILLPAVGFHCQPFLARYYNIDDGGPRKAKTMHVKVLDLLGHCRLPINFRRMPTALRSTCRPTRLYHDVTAEFVMRIQHDVLYQDT